MDDPDDVILYLFPHSGEGFHHAARATARSENKSRFLAARRSDAPKPRDIPHRQERAGTELPEERGLLEKTDCLVVTFSHGARTRVGVVCGCAPNVDLVFQDLPGISKFHLAFTFNDQNRPIARDLGSTGGTKVTYNGEEGERMSKFDWPLQGPSIARGKPPVLNITDLVQFKVIVPPRDITSQDYLDRVARFREGTTDPENLFASLILISAPGTRLPTGQQTPSTGPRPIHYKKELGAGTFGVVTYVWNGTIDEENVVKEPLKKLIHSGNFDIKSWKREAGIMRHISHDHIVAFRGATFSPHPKLTFEYVSEGSLDTHSNLSTFESTQILRQLLSALQYLHERRPPVGHRDIKPENILVAHRGDDGILVKFADFGLSKASDTLKTFCGTLFWAAPEIHLKVPDPMATADETYSVKVDLWSLGQVAASLECGLPEYKEAWKKDAVAWVRAVREHVSEYEQYYQDQGTELLYFLLDNMLVEDPEERSSTDYCYAEALRLSNCDSQIPFLQRIKDTRHRDSSPSDTELSDDDDGSSTPKPSILQSDVESESADEASTIRLDPQSDSRDGSETPSRRIVESINSSLIANLGYRDGSLIDSLVNATESEEWQLSSAPIPDTQPSRVPATSVALPQESMVDGLLRKPEDPEDPEAASLISKNDGEATEGGDSEAQANDQSKEQDDLSFFIRHHLGREVQGDGAREAVEASGVGIDELRQMRKRTWPADASLSVSLPQSFTHPLSGAAAQQRADTFNRGSKGPPGPADHKRSKRGE
ncbi:MAG: hypothetical protein Q9166_007350 [cf. Caloplaca sp. 2 TL-2023]